MLDYIFIAGSPGSGKTTIAQLLKEKLGGTPLIDFGDLRVFHLNEDWSNASEEEEQMSFENLLCILQNYKNYGYQNVIINDLKDERVRQLPFTLAGSHFKIFTLTLDDVVLRKRMLDPERDSGFRDVEAASKWNKKVREREIVQNEYKIDNSSDDPTKTVGIILGQVKG